MGDDVTQMLLSTPAVFTMKRKGKKPVQNRCLFLAESPTYAFKKTIFGIPGSYTGPSRCRCCLTIAQTWGTIIAT